MPEDMVDGDGNPVNALYGYCRFLGDFIEQVNPEHVAVLFDESLSTSFRTEIYPEYKANRDPAPPELKRQFEQCRRYVRALGVMEIGSPRYEADDLIGTLVEHGRRQGRPSTIVSRDKDLTQLLSKDDVFWDFAGKGKLGYDEIPASFGVWPEQIADFLALAGDAVDNIKGVPGVGRKTANVILNTAFRQPAMAVDTHIFRVANRTGLALGKTPLEVERKLLRAVPEEFRKDAHHWLILHGRYTCLARKPKCGECIVRDLCREGRRLARAAGD